MIKEEGDVFGLLFIGDGAKIYRTTFLNIMVPGKDITVAVL